MSKQLGELALALMLGISMLSNTAEARTGRPGGDPENAEIIKGQLVKIDGELYVMRSADGEEFRLQITKDTKMHGLFKVGDKIEVEITRQGTVETIRLSGE